MSQLPNSSVRWNHDYLRTGTTANTLDYLSTAMHEIGHVLGFVSGVDRPGWLNARVDSNSKKDYLDSLKIRIKYTTPLDLFRYSAKSNGNIDLSLGGDPFLSVNGGQTAIARFATGKDSGLGGDGNQASHWKGQTGSTGIMKHALAVGERSNIAQIDLRALDIIGWDTISTGINTSLNLATLLNSAKAGLAQRSGMTIATMEANPTLAAQRLGIDRTADVLDMVENSEVYEGRKNNGSGGSSGSWQEILEIFAQEGLFSLFGDDVLPALVQLRGTGGSDVLRGRANADLLIGGSGDDVLIGQAGSDWLRGNRGEDTLRGEAGEDWLNGGKGDDLLAGGQNRNILIGGKGEDRFLLETQGFQIVRDFEVGEDKLQLGAGLQFDQLFDQLNVEQRGKHTLISLNNNPLMQLQNSAASAINLSDVIA
jgi:Ca2+-binding RTX toxin-like protein